MRSCETFFLQTEVSSRFNHRDQDVLQHSFFQIKFDYITVGAVRQVRKYYPLESFKFNVVI